MDYQKINKETIEKWIKEDDWEWAKPISHEEYLKAITGIMDYVLDISDVSDIAQPILTKTSNSKTDNNNIPTNISEDNEVIIQNTNNQIETFKANLSYLIYETTNKLYNIYESIKINIGNRTLSVGILFFILFSILVVRIKDTIALIFSIDRKLNRLA